MICHLVLQIWESSVSENNGSPFFPSSSLLRGCGRARTSKVYSVVKRKEITPALQDPVALAHKTRDRESYPTCVTSNEIFSKNFLKANTAWFPCHLTRSGWCVPCLAASERVKHTRIFIYLFFLRIQGFSRNIPTQDCAQSAQFLSAYNPDQQFGSAKDYHKIFANRRWGKKEMVECLEKLANYFSSCNRWLVRQPRLWDAHVQRACISSTQHS